MSNQRVILCGGASAKAAVITKEPIELRLWGTDANVALKITDITERMLVNLPPRVLDLLEIAAYVYCADQATTRGGKCDRGFGERWRRQFHFYIPVREPEIWSEDPVRSLLRNTLGFLSEDEYCFTFVKLDNPPSISLYLDFATNGAGGFPAEEVVLFSGGLDSLGGAIQEAVIAGRRVALVSHRSCPKIAKRQCDLISDLGTRWGVAPFHVPVWVNKEKALTREDTQRTRSFLYACLGGVVARAFDLWRVCFYENGIVSINLPISSQVLGARGSRTTHPQVLNGFSDLFSAIFEGEFIIENPFLWMTKAEVVRRIIEAGCRDLIKHTTSCIRVRDMTTLKTHCGVCSQCIDRKFAVLAAGCKDGDDPEEMYDVDLLTGKRERGESRTVLESYIRTARSIKDIPDKTFFSRYPETFRVLSHLRGVTIDQTASELLKLYKRHSRQVCDVIAQGIRDHADEIAEGRLPDSCLLALALPDRYRKPDQLPAFVNGFPKDESIFRRNGQSWLVVYDGVSSNVRHSKGMEYIAHLLQSPGEEWHALRLSSVIAGKGLLLSGSTGEMLDKQAIDEYRDYLDSLREELQEAEENDDLSRSASIKRQIEALEEHVIKATGLGGRVRKAPDDSERARKAIYMAINRAVENIKKEHPHLGQHLENTIKLGRIISYSPETPIVWLTRHSPY